MFEVAEIGHTVTSEEYDKQVPILRERLLEAQVRIAEANLPVIVLFAGVDGAGKGALANLLSWWMDARRIVTHAYNRPTSEERERPEFWRFWRDLPARGTMGVYLKAWYSKPLLQRAYSRISEAEFASQLDEIMAFEETLVHDGAVIVKFWMHLGRDQQEERLRTLEQDPLTAWRVGPRDWEHWGMYEDFVRPAEDLIARTSVAHAPWIIVEGTDANYRSLEVGTRLLAAIDAAVDAQEAGENPKGADESTESVEEKDGTEPKGERPAPRIEVAADRQTVLDALDLSKTMDRDEYETRLTELRARLNRLHRLARAERLSTILVFEGMDAAGKGGAIRRLTHTLDARSCRTIAIGPPSDEEHAHHYLWRFWRLLPSGGRVLIFDRSWYGRVLVERVEGFATAEEWSRAYREINDFERHLTDHYVVLLKFWIQVSDKEQEKRFKERAEVPYKRWKLTEEDWRNRRQRPAYERAVHDMVAHTSTPAAPWLLVEGDDKRYARIRVLDEVCERLEKALQERGTLDRDDGFDLSTTVPHELD